MNRFNQHAQQEAPASTVSVATVCCHMCGGDNNKEHCAQTHHCAANSLNFSPLWISAAFVAVNMRAIYPRSTESVHAEEKMDNSLDKAQRRRLRAVGRRKHASLMGNLQGFARHSCIQMVDFSAGVEANSTFFLWFWLRDCQGRCEPSGCLLVLVRKCEQNNEIYYQQRGDRRNRKMTF